MNTLERAKDNEVRMSIIKPIDDLIGAAINSDFNAIDSKIIPAIEQLDPNMGNVAANQLLAFADSKKADIRDAVATAFDVLHIEDVAITQRVNEKMRDMATEDDHVYAAGRAAKYLLGRIDGPDHQENTKNASSFRLFLARAEFEFWNEELTEAIPELSPYILP